LAEAQFNLGVAFWHGKGVERRCCARAVEWFLKAAKQGHLHASFHLASAYKNGEGVAKDMGE
jgi:TPR repeat protein